MPAHITRTLAEQVNKTSHDFKVLLVTGPRQVGKTTLLQDVGKKDRSYITLDDLTLRTAAQEDPAGFIERLDLPVLIDEVQYAPNLFPYIKMTVDKAKKTGLFWLTGSQQFDMMKNVTESLAGRAGILQLQGITLAEEQGRAGGSPFLPTLPVMKMRQKTAKPLTAKALFEKIWRGSYPDVVLQNGKNWERFYDSYVSTYIQRDVQDYLGIKNKATFLKFMQIAASRTAQLLRYSEIARDVGVSEVTIKSWIGVLQASGIVTLLEPYHKNHTSRLIKTPKLHFMDTGLCAFLTGWLNPAVLERGAMAGALLESYVASEIIKSYLHHGRTPRVYFYRDQKKNEVDLLIEENGTIYPIEIKKTATPTRADCKAFSHLALLKMPIGAGAVVCTVKALTPLAENVDAVPVGYI
jgi:predicted AAA+ superfamily ATPase